MHIILARVIKPIRNYSIIINNKLRSKIGKGEGKRKRK